MFIIPAACLSQGCGFKYTQQPPSTALPEGCNHYGQNNRIVLECAVSTSVKYILLSDGSERTITA